MKKHTLLVVVYHKWFFKALHKEWEWSIILFKGFKFLCKINSQSFQWFRLSVEKNLLSRRIASISKPKIWKYQLNCNNNYYYYYEGFKYVTWSFQLLYMYMYFFLFSFQRITCLFLPCFLQIWNTVIIIWIVAMILHTVCFSTVAFNSAEDWEGYYLYYV